MREERHEQRRERTSKARQGRRRIETEKQTENSTTFSVSSNNQSATFSESPQNTNLNNQSATFSESHQNTNSNSERSELGEKPKVGTNSTYLGDLLGGGTLSKGATQWDIELRELLDLLRAAIARTELQLKLDSITPGEGN